MLKLNVESCTCSWFKSFQRSVSFIVGFWSFHFEMQKTVLIYDAHLIINPHYCKACSCSRYNAGSNWLIVGHYSPVMHTGRQRTCKNKAKSHIKSTTCLPRTFGLYGKISNLDIAVFTTLLLGQYEKVLDWDFPR